MPSYDKPPTPRKSNPELNSNNTPAPAGGTDMPSYDKPPTPGKSNHTSTTEQFRSQTGSRAELPRSSNRFSGLQDQVLHTKEGRQSRKRSLSPLSKTSQKSSSKLQNRSQTSKPSTNKDAKLKTPSQSRTSSKHKGQTGNNIPVIGSKC